MWVSHLEFMIHGSVEVCLGILDGFEMSGSPKTLSVGGSSSYSISKNTTIGMADPRSEPPSQNPKHYQRFQGFRSK